MHYRNGRKATNGDTIVSISGNGTIEAFGVLYDAHVHGGDYCNGSIAMLASAGRIACLCDCLHVDDIAALLAEKGLDKRPAGK